MIKVSSPDCICNFAAEVLSNKHFQEILTAADITFCDNFLLFWDQRLDISCKWTIQHEVEVLIWLHNPLLHRLFLDPDIIFYF